LGDEKRSTPKQLGKVLGKAATSVVNLGVAGASAAGALALHSWPILALGGAAYAALVAWDMVTPEFWRKALGSKTPTKLPQPEGLQDPRVQVTGGKPGRERPLLGEPLHPHGPLHHLPLAVHSDPALVERDGDDSQVHPGGEAAVEAHLLQAIVPAPFQGREIEKAQVQGLFDLVGVWAREEHGGDVGVADFDRAHRVGIGLRAGEGWEERGQVQGLPPKLNSSSWEATASMSREQARYQAGKWGDVTPRTGRPFPRG
jgi:hypothetical protein